jgi:AcrR family transcriptional regulator
MISTKEKILDTAERLFSEWGYDAVSLRHIIGEAGVNLAAVHYHFGSKQELLDAIVHRKVDPVNRDRLTLLDRCENEASPAGPSLERILDAFLRPVAEKADQYPQFVRLMGRIHAEGLLPDILHRHFATVIARFTAALRRTLPDLSEREFGWRIHFLIASMAAAMTGSPLFPPLSLPTVFGERMTLLSAFICGGLRAPACEKHKSRKNK